MVSHQKSLVLIHGWLGLISLHHWQWVAQRKALEGEIIRSQHQERDHYVHHNGMDEESSISEGKKVQNDVKFVDGENMFSKSVVNKAFVDNDTHGLAIISEEESTTSPRGSRSLQHVEERNRSIPRSSLDGFNF